MKNLFLITALFFSITCFGQTQINSYRNEVGTWNEYSSKWQYGTMNKANIPIRFYSDRIVMENKARSVYVVTEDLGEDDGYSSDGVRRKIRRWKAYDKDGKRCSISLSVIYDDDYDPFIFTVMYDDVMLRFYCTKSEYDRLLN